jgi:predicted Zn-dependent peptidase
MNFQKRKLSNGMTVLFEKRELPIAALSITNTFGGSHEDSKIKGVAHFIEHLLFTGTKTRTHEDISREIEKKGGILNAFTAQDVTSFWFKLPSEHIISGLNILTDMLTNAAFKSDKFEKEKKVILEEIKMYHDDPRQHVYEKIEENLYNKPFGDGIIGSEETVSNLSRDFVSKLFKQKYSPENYIITIVGNANLNEICDYLEKNFSKGEVELKSLPIQLRKNIHTTEERPGIDQAHFVFATHSPPGNSQKMFTLEVLDAFLANGMSSKLFLTIREERGLAYNIRSSINTEQNYSYYSIYVGTTKQAVSQVKDLIIDGFKQIDSMTDLDLKEAKQRIIGLQKVVSEESSGVMNALLFTHLITGNAENYYTREGNINKVTLEEVKAMAIELIKDYSTAAIVPK